MRNALPCFALALFLIGCASAGMPGNPGDDDDDVIDAAQMPPHIDAMVNPPGTPDARPMTMIDAAAPPPDAWTPPAIDAGVPPGTIDAGVGGGFCTSDGMCAPGECCFTLGMPSGICTPGTSVPGLGCVPM